MGTKQTNKKIISEKETIIKIDNEGNETQEIRETTRTYDKLDEPEYIKIYTDMWCKFNGVPEAYVRLFLSLIARMSYCDATDLDNSQIVCTAKPFSTALMKECGWSSEVSLKKGLKALCDCNAIRRVNRGMYQVNPSFAGKGLWKYNPKYKQGGIVDLVATFDFVNKTVETKIEFQADEEYVNAVTEEAKKADKVTRQRAIKSAKKDVEQETVVKKTKIR